jgi:uncharacterized membrane protein
VNTARPGTQRLELRLARMLGVGTGTASVLIGLGLTLPAALAGNNAVMAGVIIFILLPVLRVILMLIIFLRARDFPFAAISALVLIVIALGFLAGSLSVHRF